MFRYELTSVMLPLAVLFIILTITSSGFLSNYNITSILQQTTIFVLIGLAQMFALSLSHFNLAVGAMGSLSGVMMGFFMQELGLPVVIAIIFGLLIATFLGWIQGTLIARTGINPFIITLALVSVFTGLSAVITKGQPFSTLPVAIKIINEFRFGAVPLTFIIALIISALVYFTFRYMTIGRHLLAVGENARAALFSGINVKKTITIGHMLSGLLCGIAAVMQIARFGSAQISIGDGWMLPSFVVTLLGGTLLSGGRVSTIGTLLGSFLMVFIYNALVLWGVSSFMFQAAIGLILLGAFEINRARLMFVKNQPEILSNIPGEDELNE